MATSETPDRPTLCTDVDADVCIVGAGIAGLSAAYFLSREGKSVIVLDNAEVGGSETSRTTAHLSSVLDTRYVELERLHGARGSRLAAQSHATAIDRIEAIVAQEKIACDFERLDGYLFVPPGESTEGLHEELLAAHRAGLTQATRVDRAPMAHFDTGPCLRFPRQAQLHPLKYVYALAHAIERAGGRIFTATRAAKFEDGKPGQVTTSRGQVVTANSIVVAANTPVNDWVTVHTKQAAYRSYVIGARIPTESAPPGLFWDTADPFHYMRLQSEGDQVTLIVGGEDHKAGQAANTDERFGRLEHWMRQRFPQAKAVQFRWSGQVIQSIDGLAYIGRNSQAEPNLYITTGDSGNGMTHGTIAGLLITDLILRRENAWTSLYDPLRIRLRAAAEFAKENLNVAAQFADYATPGERSSPDQIAPGDGAILRRGLTKVAVSRGVHGGLHQLSAVCPHLGCLVDWNSTELTWDCPCHGSRFDLCGRVINGPAIEDLQAAE